MARDPDPTPPLPSQKITQHARSFMRFVALSYFKVRVEGAEHVPLRGPAIVLGNHPTFADPYLVGWGVRRWITWLAWDEAFDWPVIGPLITALGAVPLNLERADSASLRAAYAVLRAERLLGVFFEGKRTVEGNFQINDPLPGASRIALRTGAPIVPFSISGARRLWPYSAPFPKPGPIVVRYHAPIYPDLVGEGLSTRKRAALLTRLMSEAVCSGLPADGSLVSGASALSPALL